MRQQRDSESDTVVVLHLSSLKPQSKPQSNPNKTPSLCPFYQIFPLSLKFSLPQKTLHSFPSLF